MAAAALAAIAASMSLLVGCGSPRGGSSVVAYVGQRQIDRQTLDRWASILASEAGEPAGSSALSRRRALSLLISGNWIIGEATARGVQASPAAVARRVSASGGQGDVAAFERWTGRKRAELEFEAAADLGAEGLRRLLAAQESVAAEVTPDEVRAHYLREPRFHHREMRKFVIVERYGSAHEAARAMGRLRAGGHVGHVIIPESAERPANLPEPGENGLIHTAIFRARPGVWTGPLPLNRKWAYFKITHVEPPGRVPFGSVKAQIEQEVSSMARRQASSTFITAWRRKWRARTSCVGRVLVSACRQYVGEERVTSVPFKLG